MRAGIRQQAGPRIEVVGGGIGGMAAAAFLHRAGLAVTVHEQASALTEVGAGLVLAPNAVRPLRAMGVIDSALRRAVPLDWGWEFRRWQDGTVLSAERLDGVCERLYGERTYTAHRAHVLDALRSAVPDEAVRLGARCTAVEPHADGVRLTFADGSRTDADLVIGADGMHSLVRATVAAPERPTFAGLCAFRTVVPAEAAPAFALRRAQTLWLGPGHHFVHYPISGGAGVNVAAFAPSTDETAESWSATATIEEFHAEFADWDDRVTALIKSGAIPGRWALYDRPPLPSWTLGRMTLLGDAAHPMFPFYGQGAAQALEDAAVLARCLTATPDAPDEALARYESRRIPRTTRLQQVSHARAEANHLPDGPEQRARDAALGDADPLLRSGWIYGYDASAAPA
ncbi:FAD-dependent monooxygenase [Streptomyces sp. NPDC002790]|uniref:FAD-dependent monooxygenase n=1 Tax=Streptomyces sp. NPDC002790 TaxID=3154431 RepID=UPI00333455BE